MTLGIYYLSHEDAEVLENSKSIQKTKQKLREMSRIITPEMHAFSKLHLPKVKERYFQTLTRID